MCIFGLTRYSRKFDQKLAAGILSCGTGGRLDNEEANPRAFVGSSLVNSNSKITKISDNIDNGCLALQQQHRRWHGSHGCYRSKWNASRFTTRYHVPNADSKNWTMTLNLVFLTWQRCASQTKRSLTLSAADTKEAILGIMELSCPFGWLCGQKNEGKLALIMED